MGMKEIMKKDVIDIDDLRKASPLFRGPFGRFFGWFCMKYVCMERVNRLHGKYCHLRGTAFTSSVLADSDVDIRYEIRNRNLLNELPEGAFIVVANHPIGSIDGIILIDVFAGVRPDFKVMANGVLTKIGAMEDCFIPVEPVKQANAKNINGIRTSFEYLQDGHPIGFFPAGSISSYNKEKGRVYDSPWRDSIIRFIRKAGVPVYPVYFDFCNSRFFYRLGAIDWRIRMLRIPAEVFNKKGKTVDVYLRPPVTPEEMGSYESDDDLARFLQERTYAER